jgi:hypothetical protein
LPLLLTKLELFAMEFNALSGSLPPLLAEFANIKEFTIAGNQLTSTLPKELVSWT